MGPQSPFGSVCKLGQIRKVCVQQNSQPAQVLQRVTKAMNDNILAGVERAKHQRGRFAARPGRAFGWS
eukprot:3457425-Lingulodinium_polyedra.AAC.1